METARAQAEEFHIQETFFIDPEAKPHINLIKVPDAAGRPYFIGKLQFPAIMKFERGASFMVFLAETGIEELQIAPIDPSRRSKARANCGASITNGKFSIDLRPMIDFNGSVYYVGEAIGFFEMDLEPGIFFTIFTSIPGQERIQISKLQFKPKPRYDAPRNTFNPRHFENI
jgi:hypothetical protein